MSIDYVRRAYGIAVKRGSRVEYTGEGRPEYGTVTSARNGRLMIRLDGIKHTMPFHPTWKLRVLPDQVA